MGIFGKCRYFVGIIEEFYGFFSVNVGISWEMYGKFSDFLYFTFFCGLEAKEFPRNYF